MPSTDETIRIAPDPRGGCVLTCSMHVPRPIDEVFAFFADAGNLGLLTPDRLRFEILTPLPIDMRIGTLIDYTIRIRGIPARWRTRIPVWEPPHRFVDEQLRGPYHTWIHEHTFEQTPSGTLVRDHVRYTILGGFPGARAISAIAHTLVVKRDLLAIFRFRTRKLREIFRTPADQTKSALNGVLGSNTRETSNVLDQM